VDKARAALIAAMDRWDESATDAAVAGLARADNPSELWEVFLRYGARDYRSIGHKAIDVANTHRVLGVIGWRDAEPALRSLAYALLMHEGGNPAERDDPADRPWRRNQELAQQIPDNWRQGKDSRQATVDLLATIRGGSPDDACDQVVELLRAGAGPRSLWDAIMLGAAELLPRQPGIVSLHSVTTTNAIHYAYLATRSDLTRRLLLLQNAAFLPMFRESMRGRGAVGEFALDQLDPAALTAQGSDAVAEIFSAVGSRSTAAAAKTLAYARDEASVRAWLQRARQLTIHKGTDAHDYKFGYAVFEDVAHISRPWRAHYLAGATQLLKGTNRRDNPLIDRIRTALAG
jgi:hypothetical protein